VTLPLELPVVDHHCHLSPNAEGVAAAARFARAGGTHLFLATQEYTGEVPRTLDGYRAQFEITERLAQRIRAETDVVAYVVVAPYPVDLVRASEAIGVAAAVDLQRSALDLAGRWVEEQRAVALGEVGRPHFPVDSALVNAAEQVFRHALAVARDAGCPAVVHSEDLSADGYRQLAALAASESFPLGKLVKHYAKSSVTPTESAGIVPSYLARRELVGEVLGRPGPWFLETDFLDDPRRKGAVLDIETIPRRAMAAVAKDPANADRLRVPFESAVDSVYGLRPVVPTRGQR
jgi:TatD-related deoxyribonuclease